MPHACENSSVRVLYHTNKKNRFVHTSTCKHYYYILWAKYVNINFLYIYMTRSTPCNQTLHKTATADRLQYLDVGCSQSLAGGPSIIVNGKGQRVVDSFQDVATQVIGIHVCRSFPFCSIGSLARCIHNSNCTLGLQKFTKIRIPASWGGTHI